MKCQHCDYEYRFSFPNESVGDKGDFYKLPVHMEREEEWGSGTERVRLYSCPSCKKTFVD